MHFKTLQKTVVILLFLGLQFLMVLPVGAFGVLTHQALIDEAWEKEIKPLLQKNYPEASEQELNDAKAYAYGGAVIHDMGYFPFNKELYSNLVHYVRTGDFVEALFTEAQNLNEYAFAVGALSHFYGDKFGHSLATNRAVPMLYPDAKERFGKEATYHDDPKMHLKVEMGFDVLQVALGRYPSEAYKNLIGFRVSQDVLERAFRKTYGLELEEHFMSLCFSLWLYRGMVKTVMPSLIRIAWQMKKTSIKADSTDYPYLYEEWAKLYTDPGFEERVAAFIIKILPKPGPLDPFTFKPADDGASGLLNKSYHATLQHFRKTLTIMQVRRVQLPNTDLDTGHPTTPNDYILTDETYDQLLYQLKKNDFRYLTPELKKHLLAYFKNPGIILPAYKQDFKYRIYLLSKLEEQSTD